MARLVQRGVRQARYVGRTKTLFQLLLAATVANLTLLAGTELAGTLATGPLQVAASASAALLFAAWAALVAVQRATGVVCARAHPRLGAAPCRLALSRLAASRPDF